MPKTTPKPSEEEQSLYIAINDASALRRQILEAAKESIGFLQRSERLESIRAGKFEAYKMLRITLKELLELNSRLNKISPKLKITEAFLKKDLAKKMDVDESEGVPQIMPRTRIDKLEEELRDIESKINSL